MRKFNVKKGNFMKSKNNTTKMMNHVIISLIPIMVFAFYKNGILPIIKGTGELLEIFKPLLLIIIPIRINALGDAAILIKQEKS